jgi:hypothetical protein
MKSHGVTNRIQIWAATVYTLTSIQLEPLGCVDIKRKGPMEHSHWKALTLHLAVDGTANRRGLERQLSRGRSRPQWRPPVQ